MAFCQHCGRKLEDGQACTCTESAAAHEMRQPEAVQAQPQMQGGAAAAAAGTQVKQESVVLQQSKQIAQNAFAEYMLLLKAPATNSLAFIRKGDMVTSAVFMGVQALASSIFMAICASKLNSLFSFGGMMGFKLVSGVGAFFQALICSLLVSVTLAGIFMGFTRIMRGSVSFQEALAVAAMRSVITIPVILASCILVLLNPGLGLGVYLFVGGIAGFAFLSTANDQICTLEPDKKVYMMAGVGAVFVLAFSILMSITTAIFAF